MRQYSLLAALLVALATVAAAQECRVRVHVVNYDWNRTSEHHPDRLTHQQLQWWLDSGQKKFPRVCLVSAHEEADYILAWASTETTDTISLPSVTTTTGTVNAGGRTATYSETSLTQNARTQEVATIWVSLQVLKLQDGKPQKPPVFTDGRNGKWRWSKPDKDAFERAIKFLDAQ